NPGPRDSMSLVHDGANGRVLFYGGHSCDGTNILYYSDVGAFDTPALAWTEIAPKGEVAPQLSNHSAVFVAPSRMYVWGGSIADTFETSDVTYLMESPG